jgi:hypothetical protein
MIASMPNKSSLEPIDESDLVLHKCGKFFLAFVFWIFARVNSFSVFFIVVTVIPGSKARVN